MSAQIRHLSAKLAAAHHYKGEPEVIEATRNLAARKVQEYIERIVAEAPEFTAEQKAVIVAALGGAR